MSSDMINTLLTLGGFVVGWFIGQFIFDTFMKGRG